MSLKQPFYRCCAIIERLQSTFEQFECKDPHHTDCVFTDDIRTELLSEFTYITYPEQGASVLKAFPWSSRKRKGKARKYVYCCVRFKSRVQSQDIVKKELEELKVLHGLERKKRKLAECVANSYYREWRVEREAKDRALAEQVFKPTLLPNSMYIQDELLHYSTDGGLIGSGSFGTVRLCKFKGDFVAVKSLECKNDEPMSVITKRAIYEAKILLNLKSHQSIPTLLGVSVDARPVKIIMQFYGVASKSLTLHSLCKSEQQLILSEQQWLCVIKQVAEVIDHVHNCGYIHNDIKINNVVIYENSNNFVPVLIDFGKACRRESGAKKNLGPEEQKIYSHKYKHIAPETINGSHKQSIYSDIYSFGYLVHSIVSNTCQQSKVLHKIIKQCYKVKAWHYRASLEKCIQDIQPHTVP